MRAGELRHRVEIQAAIETANSFGEVTQDWRTIATRWAAIEPLSGREASYAAQLSPDVTHRVRLRHYAGLTPKHRLRFGTRVLQVDTVTNEKEMDVETIVMCIEAV